MDNESVFEGEEVKVDTTGWYRNFKCIATLAHRVLAYAAVYDRCG